MFLVPILLVAGISISHVVSWYDIANPISWAIYLSIAIEVAAMTALVAATNRIKGGVWFMFILVTIIQMIGNIFFSFKEIDANGDLFKSWVELTGPLWEMFGSDPTDISSQKRWLAFLEGGLLPIISLTSLHFFTKYDNGKKVTESGVIVEKNHQDSDEKEVIVEKTTTEEYSLEDLTDEQYGEKLKEYVNTINKENEKIKYTPTEKELEEFDKFLKNLNQEEPNLVKPESELEKFTPTDEQLNKIQEVLNNYNDSESIEDEKEIDNEEEVEKVFFETQEEKVIEDTQEVNSPIPNVEEQKINKVLKYFK